MKRTTQSIILIAIGSGLLFHFSVIPHLVDVKQVQFLFVLPNFVLYGGYFALGMGVIGFIRDFRRKRKSQKRI